jgi:hypothetical protein
MATREHEPESLVGDRRVALGLDRAAQRLELDCLPLAFGGPAAPPQAIDCAVAGRADDPGAGLVRQAVARPALQGGREGVLDDLLRQVEIADAAREDTDCPAEPLR